MVIKGLQGQREREAETNTQILSEARNEKDKTQSIRYPGSGRQTDRPRLIESGSGVKTCKMILQMSSPILHRR